MDKRKTGRIGARQKGDKEPIATHVLARYKHIRRGQMDQAIRSPRGRVETIHMTLAREFKISCQAVLDIIDPDRRKQKARIRRHDFREQRRAAWEAFRDEQDRLAREFHEAEKNAFDP